jgi:hypothetical protein
LDAPALGAALHSESIGVDGNGRATLLYEKVESGSTSIYAQRLTAAGPVGQRIEIASGLHTDNGGAAGVESRIALNSHGDAAITWAGGADSRVFGRLLSEDGELGSALEISGAQSEADHPQVALSATGQSAIAFVSSDPNASDRASGDRYRARRIAPDGTLGPMLTVSRDLVTRNYQFDLASLGDDRALAVWSQSRAGALKARILGRANLGPTQVLDGSGGRYFDLPDIAATTNRANIVWAYFPRSHAGRVGIRERELRPRGALGPIRTLMTPRSVYPYAPIPDIDIAGSAHFAVAFTRGRDVILAVR